MLHVQVNVAAVNFISIVHEVLNGLKYSKNSLKTGFENINIGI